MAETKLPTKLSELKPDPGNPRTIADNALAGLKVSIDEYGDLSGIVWNERTCHLVCGHQRVRALQEEHGDLSLGAGFAVEMPNGDEFKIRYVDWPEEREIAANLIANSTNISGDFTHEAAQRLEMAKSELGEAKFEALLLDKMEVPDPPPQETSGGEGGGDEAPGVVDDPIVQLGDLITLGQHRLLCGDATSEADIDRLMAGDKANMIFTDPPYNVDYEGYTEEKLKIDNDKMSDNEFSQFLIATFKNYRIVCNEDTGLYVCHPSSYQREFQNALENAGFEIRCQIIWCKNTFAWGFGRYKFRHEPIFYAHVKGKSDSWYGDKTQNTVWEVDKPSASKLHPTMKPVELIEHALINSSKPHDIVCDLFGGSGSTLIACERLERKCVTMELDPRYAQVIAQRYIDHSGRSDVIVERNGDDIDWKDLV